MLVAGLAVSALASVAALVIAALVWRNAHRPALVATPDQRSSHSRPIPTGGGLGIVAGGSITTLFVAYQSPWPAPLLLIASLLVAAIELWHDRRPLPKPLRLGAQAVLLGLTVGLGIPLFLLRTETGIALPAGVLVALVAVAGVYWMSIFNAMDAIDGLVASQAVFMLGAAIAIALVSGAASIEQPTLWWLVGIAASVLGFLMLNWAPARILMGEVGSTYLGFVIVFLALLTIVLGWLDLAQWLVLGALIVTDATVTLLRRLLTREKSLRLHASQALARRWGSHNKVTTLYLAIAIVWLLPLAALAGLGGNWTPLALALAYLPLAGLALYAGAGAPEKA